MEQIEQANQSLVGDSWFMLDMKGLKITSVPSFEEWERTGEMFAKLQRVLPMAIGDFINAGEDAFGDRYTQVLDYFGQYEYHTVANYASIMKKVPYERRIEGLTYSHYKAVAYLESQDEQLEAQYKAKENNWTARELWEYTHKGDTRGFPDLIDEVSRGIGMLYTLTTSIEQDENLDSANRYLMLAKEDYERREREV